MDSNFYTLTSVNQNNFGLKLIPITYRDIFYLREVPCDLFYITGDIFRLLCKKKTIITKPQLQVWIQKGARQLFLKEEDYLEFKDALISALMQVTRSISMGNPAANAGKQIQLLTLNLRNLYQDPSQDGLLNIQFQSLKNLNLLLQNDKSIIPELYAQLSKQNHFYIFSQPMQSSLFLIGLLLEMKVYTDKEIESLFLTSYFKDIGMSNLPVDLHHSPNLTEKEKTMIQGHAQDSRFILEGKLPLSSSYLKIIEQHHLTTSLGEIASLDFIIGSESALVNAMDIVAAMTSQRPFRKPLSLYNGLESVKQSFAGDFPLEFKSLVHYFSRFFSNIK